MLVIVVVLLMQTNSLPTSICSYWYMSVLCIPVVRDMSLRWYVDNDITVSSIQHNINFIPISSICLCEIQFAYICKLILVLIMESIIMLIKETVHCIVCMYCHMDITHMQFFKCLLLFIFLTPFDYLCIHYISTH